MSEYTFNLERQKIARVELSNEVLEWSRGRRCMFLEMATGVGKTYNTLNIIGDDYRGGKILVLVPEIPLIKSFRDDCEKLGFGYLLSNMELACYASMGKYTGDEWEYLVCDEGHWSTSDIRAGHIEDFKFRRAIGLSATLSEENEEVLFSRIPFEKFILTASQAIDRGILPEPQIVIVEVNLDDAIRRNEFKFGDKITKCTDKEYYKYISNSISYWKDRYEDGGDGNKFQKEKQKNMMLSLGGKRSRFLSECKTKAAKGLIDNLDSRYIVFCGSLKQAQELNGKQLVSSLRTKKQNAELISEFNSHKTNCLFAKGMLKEGINLQDCKYGVVIQLNNKERSLIQQLGRILRDPLPSLYILTVKNTVDERFLRNSIASLNKNYIKYEVQI